MKNWTKLLNKKKVVKDCNSLIHQIINSIYNKKINIHCKYNLSEKELLFLYYWPLYIAINTFYDRLFSSLVEKKKNKKIHIENFDYKITYFSNTEFVATNYYNNIKLNDNLKLKIYNQIIKKKKIKNIFNKSFKNENNLNKFSLYINKNFFINKLYNILSKTQKFFLNTNIIYEGDKFFFNILPLKYRFQDYGYKRYYPNLKIREEIKLILEPVLKKNLNIYGKYFSKIEIKALVEIFKEWIDFSIPFSLIEGLEERIDYYKKFVKNKNIKKVFSATGYIYNDNFKIFAMLSKRNSAKLIGIEDGITNYIQILSKKNSSNPTHFKTISLFYFTDIFCLWGKGKLHDTWKEVNKKFKTRIIKIGSPYLSNLKKWQKESIDKNNFTLLYPMGPLRRYSESLERITFEENYEHFKNVSLFIKKLLVRHKGLRIIYKPFIGIKNYPIEKILKKEIAEGKVLKINSNLKTIMPKVDLVLFDMLSTGFTEAANIGVPTLIYNCKYYLDNTSNFGKKINSNLEKSKIIFMNKKKGIENFDFIINNINLFKKNSKKHINQFIESVAFPISRNKLKENLLNIK